MKTLYEAINEAGNVNGCKDLYLLETKDGWKALVDKSIEELDNIHARNRYEVSIPSAYTGCFRNIPWGHVIFDPQYSSMTWRRIRKFKIHEHPHSGNLFTETLSCGGEKELGEIITATTAAALIALPGLSNLEAIDNIKNLISDEQVHLELISMINKLAETK